MQRDVRLTEAIQICVAHDRVEHRAVTPELDVGVVDQQQVALEIGLARGK
jgi:hypothetical protein